MKAVTSAQMRAIDARAAEEFGIPTLLLMEHAGLRVVEAARALLAGLRGAKVTILAGRGNNGGDGFAVARHLSNEGYAVHVLVAGALDGARGDAAVNLEITRRSGIPVDSVTSTPVPSLTGDLIVDALLGTGIRGPATGVTAALIDAINASGLPVLSVDVPSGLDADSGRAEGPCVRAQRTVTLALPKVGLLFQPGRSLAGEITVGDIGMPRRLLEQAEATAQVTEPADVRRRLPERPPDAHKGTFGRAFVLAGSVGMTGAAALATEAVLRAGAGLAFLGCPASLNELLEAKLTEAITVPLPETETRALAVAAWDTVREQMKRSQAVAIGPGLGRHPETAALVTRVLQECRAPLVVDADALNAVAPARAGTFPPHAVITPHPGEMARLWGTNTQEVQSNRLETAERAAGQWGCVVVFKGAPTVIAAPDGALWLNPTGTPGMASGGTGDVLTGLITGLLAQGLAPMDAAIAAVYVHGAAGEQAADRLGAAGMLASDLLREVPGVLRDLSNGEEPRA
jgi:ADP-dependent NAD(P)H-hydrate dehydratase / NAD(P)H-hydrate epimerase